MSPLMSSSGSCAILGNLERLIFGDHCCVGTLSMKLGSLQECRDLMSHGAFKAIIFFVKDKQVDTRPFQQVQVCLLGCVISECCNLVGYVTGKHYLFK